MTLREKLNGERKCGGGEAGGKASDVKSVLRMQHLQNLALWAGAEASMPSYASFLGNRLATCAETSGSPLDPSLFPCQRCESILQPGFNCTVRVERNGAKVRRRHNKLNMPTKNIVIYTCHFCSHRNVKKGTPKNYMKERFALKGKSVSELESNSTIQKSTSLKSTARGSNESDVDTIATPISQRIPASESDPSDFVIHSEMRNDVENSPTTPKMTLLEGKKKKRKSNTVVKEQVASQTKNAKVNAEKVAGESSRKRRKGWSSLKEIAENSKSVNKHNITNMMLPFFMTGT